jgi:hypothetical protein
MRWAPRGWREPLRRAFQGRRSREVMSAADRGLLTEHYRDEVSKTADLIGRDLSAWLH